MNTEPNINQVRGPSGGSWPAIKGEVNMFLAQFRSVEFLVGWLVGWYLRKSHNCLSLVNAITINTELLERGLLGLAHCAPRINPDF